MSRIEELIKEKCPNGVEYKRLKSVCTDVIVPMRDRPKIFDGEIPWCRIEDIEGRYFNESLSGLKVSEEVIKEMNLKVFPTGTVICSCSASIGVYAINTRPLITNQTFIGLVCSDEIINKFLLYYMETQTKTLLKLATTGTIPYISRNKFEDLEIPVPPIEVQQEIVRILDKFTELEAELQDELEARKKQYEYYRETMLSFNNDIEIVTLDKCADIGTGSSNTIDGIDDGVYPFFVRSQKPLTMNKFEYDEIATITAGDGVGVGKVFHFIAGKYALHQRAYRIHITDKRINPKFFHYYFVARFPKFIFGNMYEGSVPSIRRPMLNKFEVPIPSMEEQNRIVDILDKFEEYCNNEEKGLPLEIEARHKQYEYYRDKLLTFERKGV